MCLAPLGPRITVSGQERTRPDISSIADSGWVDGRNLPHMQRPKSDLGFFPGLRVHKYLSSSAACLREREGETSSENSEKYGPVNRFSPCVSLSSLLVQPLFLPCFGVVLRGLSAGRHYASDVRDSLRCRAPHVSQSPSPTRLTIPLYQRRIPLVYARADELPACTTLVSRPRSNASSNPRNVASFRQADASCVE